MTASTADEVLPLHRCWELLRTARVGRLAVVVDGRPDLFPVNHVVDRGSIVFCTAAGTKLAGAVGAPVAFEVDGQDEGSDEAWSVVVHGRGEEVRRFYDLIEAGQLPLLPWHSGPKPRVVRVQPESVTGRRFTVATAVQA